MRINEVIITEATMVTHGNHDLMQMLKSIFDKWQSNKHSEQEVAELLSALGYRIKMDGDRAEIIKEAPGDIRKAIAGIAVIASLWGVNNHLAHKAYDASPQLQQLISLHQEAEAAGDEAAAENYADRIEQHKLRIDLGKGEVMGKDGRPVDVKRFGESSQSEGYPDSKQGVIDLIKNEMDPAYAAKLLVPGAKIIPDPNVDRVWGVKIGGEMAAVVYLDYPDVELAEAINVQITENMSDWLNAGVAKPIAQHILHYYQFSNKGKFTDVKKPKASEVRNGDLFVGDGGNTVIFNRRRRGYGEPFYIRVTGPNHKDTQTFSSIAKAFKGVKGPWKKLSGAGPDVAAVRDRDQGGKSVPPSDILGGNEPEYGWIHTMNKTYWPRLKPKLEAMADEIFAGLRRLPKDRRSASPYDPSVRHEALKFANAIEDIADSGFTKKKSEEFLQSLGKYSGGYGSAISNREELNKIMSTQPGRAQFAKFMLSVAKRYLDNVNDLHDEYNGVNDSVRKLRGESVDHIDEAKMVRFIVMPTVNKGKVKTTHSIELKATSAKEAREKAAKEFGFGIKPTELKAVTKFVGDKHMNEGLQIDEAISVRDTVADVEDKISALQELKQMFAIDGDRAMLKIINDKMRELLQQKKAMAGNTR